MSQQVLKVWLFRENVKCFSKEVPSSYSTLYLLIHFIHRISFSVIHISVWVTVEKGCVSIVSLQWDPVHALTCCSETLCVSVTRHEARLHLLLCHLAAVKCVQLSV